MTNGRRRQGAYADLLTGLIDLGPMTASNRFDELLEQARAQGRIDDDTARVLRWWQREALRAQADHVLATAPSLLAALDEAQLGSIESADLAEQAWGAASEPVAPAQAAPPTPAAQPTQPASAPAAPMAQTPLEPAAAAPSALVAPQPTASPAPSVAAPAVPGSDARAGRHRAVDAEASATETPLFDRVLAAHDPAPAAVPVADVAPFAEPAQPGEAEDAPVAEVLDLASPARRRRLLVAGLTVIDEQLSRALIADPP